MTSTDMPEKEQEGVHTYLILPILCNSVINHNQFTSIPEPVYLRTLPSNNLHFNILYVQLINHILYIYIYLHTHPYMNI